MGMPIIKRIRGNLKRGFFESAGFAIGEGGQNGCGFMVFGNEGWIHFATDKHRIRQMDDKAMIEKV
jgi:hypothetical protein